MQKCSAMTGFAAAPWIRLMNVEGSGGSCGSVTDLDKTRCCPYAFTFRSSFM